LNGTESSIEAYFKGEKGGLHFKIKLIPAVFDDSEKGVTIIFEDITERKKIEEERSFLAAIVESSDDAIMSMTPDGIINSWNAGAERLYGYGPAEMKGCSISKLVPPDRPDEIPGLLDKIKRGERIENFRTIRTGKDGTTINVSLTVSPIKDAAGNIVGVSSIHRNITKYIRAENALKESEEMFRVLTDSSKAAIIVYHVDTIVYVNRAALSLGGYEEKDLIGGKILDFIHPDHKEMVMKYWLAWLRGEKVPVRYELKIRVKDGGYKWADTSIAYLEYGGKPAVLATLLDITGRKRADEKPVPVKNV
jgi:PAS domain S-box-containing protein